MSYLLKVFLLIPFCLQISLAHACSSLEFQSVSGEGSCHPTQKKISHHGHHNKASSTVRHKTEKNQSSVKGSRDHCPFCLLNVCKPNLLINTGADLKSVISSFKTLYSVIIPDTLLRPSFINLFTHFNIITFSYRFRVLVPNWQSFYSIFII